MSVPCGILEAVGDRACQDLKRVLEGESRTARCLVGVSGGADSVFLLHALIAMGFKKVMVCHLDHGVRGRQSQADARWVKRLASRLGCECRVGHARLVAAEPGGSLEAAWRAARHRFFAQVAREIRCRRIFLGHQADDRAETLLFNLLRGSGLSGMAALPATSSLEMEGLRMRVIRPLVRLRAGEIRAALKAAGLAWREDATNASLEFTRNRLRHEAIPLLGKIMGRDVVPALARAAEILGEDDDCLNGLVAGLPAPAALPVAMLRAQPVSLQRRLLVRWLNAAGAVGCGFREVEGVRNLVLNGASVGRCVNLPQGRSVRLRRGMLHVEWQRR